MSGRPIYLDKENLKRKLYYFSPQCFREYLRRLYVVCMPEVSLFTSDSWNYPSNNGREMFRDILLLRVFFQCLHLYCIQLHLFQIYKKVFFCCRPMLVPTYEEQGKQIRFENVHWVWVLNTQNCSFFSFVTLGRGL